MLVELPLPRIRPFRPVLVTAANLVLGFWRKYMQIDVRIFTDSNDPFGGSAHSELVTYWFLKFLTGSKQDLRPSLLEIRGLNYGRNGL
jgi:hypothetical protein